MAWGSSSLSTAVGVAPEDLWKRLCRNPLLRPLDFSGRRKVYIIITPAKMDINLRLGNIQLKRAGG